MRPFIPNGDCLGKVWIPLNELTVLLRSGITLNKFCPPMPNEAAGQTVGRLQI